MALVLKTLNLDLFMPIKIALENNRYIYFIQQEIFHVCCIFLVRIMKTKMFQHIGLGLHNNSQFMIVIYVNFLLFPQYIVGLYGPWTLSLYPAGYRPKFLKRPKTILKIGTTSKKNGQQQTTTSCKLPDYYKKYILIMGLVD